MGNLIMPNWSHNHLTLTGPDDVLPAVRTLMAGDNGAIDFNSIVPMPPILMRVPSPVSRFDDGQPEHLRHIAINMTKEEFEASNPDETTRALAENFGIYPTRAMTHDEYEEYVKANSPSWYDWSIQNWGTKWNAGSITGWEASPGSCRIHFHTAWSAPMPYLEALANTIHKSFPSVKMICTAQNEYDGFETTEIVYSMDA